MNLDFLRGQWLRIIIYSMLAINVVFTFLLCQKIQARVMASAEESKAINFKMAQSARVISNDKKLMLKVKDYKAQGIDVSPINSNLIEIKKDLFYLDKYHEASQLISASNRKLDELLAEKQHQIAAQEEARKAQEEAGRQAELARQASEALKGTLIGVVQAAAPINQALVNIKSGKTTIASAKTNKDGKFSLSLKEGTYTVIGSAHGYITKFLYNIKITAQQQRDLTITLQQITVTQQTPAASQALPPTNSTNTTTNPPTTDTVTPPIVTPEQTKTEAEKMRDLVNAARKAQGLSLVEILPQLNNAALAKDKHMDENNYFGHCAPSGSPCDEDFIVQQGICYSCSWGFDLAAGGLEPEGAFEMWMESPGHRAYILSSGQKYIGYASYHGFHALGFAYSIK